LWGSRESGANGTRGKEESLSSETTLPVLLWPGEARQSSHDSRTTLVEVAAEFGTILSVEGHFAQRKKVPTRETEHDTTLVLPEKGRKQEPSSMADGQT